MAMGVAVFISAVKAGALDWSTHGLFHRSGKASVTFDAPVLRNATLVGVFEAEVKAWEPRLIFFDQSRDVILQSLMTSTFGLTGNEVIPAKLISDMSDSDADVAQYLIDEFTVAQNAVAPDGSQDALTGGQRDVQVRAMWLAAIFFLLLSLSLGVGLYKPLSNIVRHSRSKRRALMRPDSLCALPLPESELADSRELQPDQMPKQRHSETQYDRTFSASQRFMARINPHTMQFIGVNKAFCDLLGRPERVLLNARLDTILIGDTRQTLTEFRDVILSDKQFVLEADFFRVGHLPIPLRMTAFLMKNANGVPDHAFAVFDGNEENRKSAAQLENFKRDVDRIGRINLMGQFAAGLAHELNQPLGALVHDVDSAICVLGQAEIDVSELHVILRDIEGHAHRAGGIIRALRNMIEREDQTPRWFCLDELLKQTLAIMRSEAAAYDVDIQVSVADNCIIEGSRVQIAQVLVNLIRNAISALSSSKQCSRIIRVEAEKRDSGILLSIQDNGPGFPSHIRPFAQFETTSRTGLGLGLSISKSLVEANKGTIRHSEASGGGALFLIVLQGSTTRVEVKANG